MDKETAKKILSKAVTPSFIEYYSDLIRTIYKALEELPEWNGSKTVYEGLFTSGKVVGTYEIPYIGRLYSEINYKYRESIEWYKHADVCLKHLLKTNTLAELEDYIKLLTTIDFSNLTSRELVDDSLLSKDVLDKESILKSKKIIDLKDLKVVCKIRSNSANSNRAIDNYGRIYLEELVNNNGFHGANYTNIVNIDWTTEESTDVNYFDYINSNFTIDTMIGPIKALISVRDSSNHYGTGSPYTRYCYEYLTNKYYNMDIKDIEIDNITYVQMLLSNNYIDLYKFSTYMIEKAVENSFSGPHMDLVTKYNYYIKYNALDKSLLKKINKEFIKKQNIEFEVYSSAPYLFIDELLASKLMKCRELALETIPKGDSRLRSLLGEKTFTLLKKVVIKAPVDCIPFILGNISKLKNTNQQETIRRILEERINQEDFLIEYLKDTSNLNIPKE